MKIEDLFTRSKSNEAIEYKIGNEKLHLLGVDSDQFRKAKTEVHRKVVDGSIKADDVTAWLAAHLVTGWTFEDEFSFDNAFKLMKESPSLCETIDRVCSERANFVKLASVKSSAGASANSSSGKKSTRKTRKA